MAAHAVYNYQTDIDSENERHQQAVLDLKRIYHHYNEYLGRLFQLLMTELNHKHQMEVHALFIQHVVQERPELEAPILPEIQSMSCNASRGSRSTLKSEISTNNSTPHAQEDTDNDILSPMTSPNVTINTEIDGESMPNIELQMNCDGNEILNNAALVLQSSTELNLPSLNDTASNPDHEDTNSYNILCDSEIPSKCRRVDSDSDYEPSFQGVESVDSNSDYEPSNSRTIRYAGKSKYKCNYDGCHKTFKRKSNLTNHTYLHTGEWPFKCNHPGCGQGVGNNGALKRHMLIHSNERPFKCSYVDCDKAFKSKSNLTKHTWMHTGEYPFKCNHPGCGKGVRDIWDLKMHMLTHSNERAFKCSYCDKAFKTKQHLKQHTRLHTGEKPFVCNNDNCNAAFTHYIQLQGHIRRVHTDSGSEKPFVCSHRGCKKAFSQKGHLNRHIRRVHRNLKKRKNDSNDDDGQPKQKKPRNK
eukprot:228519_1